MDFGMKHLVVQVVRATASTIVFLWREVCFIFVVVFPLAIFQTTTASRLSAAIYQDRWDPPSLNMQPAQTRPQEKYNVIKTALRPRKRSKGKGEDYPRMVHRVNREETFGWWCFHIFILHCLSCCYVTETYWELATFAAALPVLGSSRFYRCRTLWSIVPDACYLRVWMYLVSTRLPFRYLLPSVCIIGLISPAKSSFD